MFIEDVCYFCCEEMKHGRAQRGNPCKAPVLPCGLGQEEGWGQNLRRHSMGVQETAPLRGLCSSFPVRDAMGPSPEPSLGNAGLLGDIDVRITLILDREEESGEGTGD